VVISTKLVYFAGKQMRSIDTSFSIAESGKVFGWCNALRYNSLLPAYSAPGPVLAFPVSQDAFPLHGRDGVGGGKTPPSFTSI